MGFIDLHVHSTASDGSLTPEELVRYACEKGLYAFALTDHDSVAGIPAALRESAKYPVHVIPGVEISAAIGGQSVHILGYNVNYEDPTFLHALKVIHHFKDERNIKMCAQLRSYGIDIDYESFRSDNQIGCHFITRKLIADYMLSKGYVSSIQEAFDKYLAKGKPCFIPTRAISANDAAKLIINAGGIPVLAHPIQYKLPDAGYKKLFALVETFGIRGVEAVYSTNTHEEELKFRKYAEEAGLFVTGGTDFHGYLKPNIDLGTGLGNLMIPQTMLENLIRK